MHITNTKLFLLQNLRLKYFIEYTELFNWPDFSFKILFIHICYVNISLSRITKCVYRSICLLLGIIFNNGAAWKEQRRFALRSMRDFGMGKLSMEGRIQGEAEQFVIELKKQSGQKLDLQYLITKAVSNVICAIVFGHRFDYGDPAFLKSINKINEVMLSAHLANLAIAVPILRHIPSKIRSEVSVW